MAIDSVQPDEYSPFEQLAARWLMQRERQARQLASQPDYQNDGPLQAAADLRDETETIIAGVDMILAFGRAKS